MIYDNFVFLIAYEGVQSIFSRSYKYSDKEYDLKMDRIMKNYKSLYDGQSVQVLGDYYQRINPFTIPKV